MCKTGGWFHHKTKTYSVDNLDIRTGQLHGVFDGLNTIQWSDGTAWTKVGLISASFKAVHTLLKKFTSKVDGFPLVHLCLKVITLDVKVLYDLLMLYVRRYYLLREVA